MMATLSASSTAGRIVDLPDEIVFVEVKERAREGYGGPVGAVDREKRRRVRRAAASWLQAHPETAELEIGFEVAAITDGRLERLDLVSGE